MEYVEDLEGFRDIVDRISPYHYYMYVYWNLRGRWRKILYDWIRRKPCDASAFIVPRQTVAGVPTTLRLTISLGKTPLGRGGRIAVFFPMSFGGLDKKNSLICFQGPSGEVGYGSRINAYTSKRDVRLKTIVHSTGSVFTCVEVVVEDGVLGEGDKVDIVIGDNPCKPPIVCEKAKIYRFRVAIDYHGDNVFRPIIPDPVVINVGGRARYLRCFAPATPELNQPFSLKIVAADLMSHNPSYFYEGKIFLEAVEGSIDGLREIVVSRKNHGKITVNGVKVSCRGVTRILVVDRVNGIMGQSNPICPDAPPKGFHLYYGDIHSHTELSDGVGTPVENFIWARDVEGLDFAALSDHFEDPFCYNYTLEEKWRITRKVTEKFYQPGRFVTLLGYELVTLDGHRNVYFADGVGRMIVGGEKVTMENIFSKLEGTEYILIPHAPKFHGINWYTPHNQLRQRLVEICSCWGISEEGGPCSVQHALNLGYKFGFTGGTDNHFAEPGNPDFGGLTGVYARSLTRQNIFEALKSRRTFATTGERMIITFWINGTFMGGELKLNPMETRIVTGRIVTSSPIEKIEVIRNGVKVYSIPGENRLDISFKWIDEENLSKIIPKRKLTDERYVYYYIRVKTVHGDMGWSSPIWVHEKQTVI